MGKLARCIICLFFLFLGVQWALHDPSDVLTLGTPDTDEEVSNDGDFVRARLSLRANRHWPTPNADLALHADCASSDAPSLSAHLLSSTDPNAPRLPVTLHLIPRSPPAA